MLRVLAQPVGRIIRLRAVLPGFESRSLLLSSAIGGDLGKGATIFCQANLARLFRPAYCSYMLSIEGMKALLLDGNAPSGLS